MDTLNMFWNAFGRCSAVEGERSALSWHWLFQALQAGKTSQTGFKTGQTGLSLLFTASTCPGGGSCVHELCFELCFVSAVSSRCPCLRGPRLAPSSGSCLRFDLGVFDHLLEFPLLSPFYLYSELTYDLWSVLSMHSSRGRLRTGWVRRPVDGHFLV